jgi:two-component system alkaline phosphatase synthesis response regulator PhoP
VNVLFVGDSTELDPAVSTALAMGGHGLEVIADPGAAVTRAHMRPPPDVIVLDLVCCMRSGLQVLRTLRQTGDETPVLALSEHSNELERVQVFRLGADQHATKPLSPIELLVRMEGLAERAAARRNSRRQAPPRLTFRFGDVVVNAATREVRRNGQLISLARLEFDLLLALLRRGGAAATRADLLREVWGYESDVVSRTLDTHIANLRRKLEHNPASPEHILTVRKIGYRLATGAPAGPYV